MQCIPPPRPRPLIKPQLNSQDLGFYLYLHQIAQTHKYQMIKHAWYFSIKNCVLSPGDEIKTQSHHVEERKSPGFVPWIWSAPKFMVLPGTSITYFHQVSWKSIYFLIRLTNQENKNENHCGGWVGCAPQGRAGCPLTRGSVVRSPSHTLHMPKGARYWTLTSVPLQMQCMNVCEWKNCIVKHFEWWSRKTQYECGP